MRPSVASHSPNWGRARISQARLRLIPFARDLPPPPEHGRPRARGHDARRMCRTRAVSRDAEGAFHEDGDARPAPPPTRTPSPTPTPTPTPADAPASILDIACEDVLPAQERARLTTARLTPGDIARHELGVSDGPLGFAARAIGGLSCTWTNGEDPLVASEELGEPVVPNPAYVGITVTAIPADTGSGPTASPWRTLRTRATASVAHASTSSSSATSGCT